MTKCPVLLQYKEVKPVKQLATVLKALRNLMEKQYIQVMRGCNIKNLFIIWQTTKIISHKLKIIAFISTGKGYLYILSLPSDSV